MISTELKIHADILPLGTYCLILSSAKNGGWAKTQPIKEKAMQKGIHPEDYRVCAFKDMSTGDVTLIKSAAPAKEKLEVDGTEYPLVKMEISSFSHPFYTGKTKLVDTAGRVDKFRNRYAKFQK